MTTFNAQNWTLPAEIIRLSVAQTWNEAIKEWSLEDIEILQPDDAEQQCLCGQELTKKVCHIINNENQNTAIVGIECVKKFKGDTAFKGTHLIFDALERIRTDINAKPNTELYLFAKEKILSEEESGAYVKITLARNSKLTSTDIKNREKLNRKVLDYFDGK